MHSYILALFGMFIGMLPRTSAAQLDLEGMLSETAIVEEEDAATDEILTEKEETKSQQEDIANDEDAEIPEVEDDEDTDATPEEDEAPEDSADDEDIEDIEDTPQTKSADDEIAAETVAEDDFMTQYLNEIEEQEKAPKSEAMRLMMQKDDTSVLPEDTQKLFEESAKIRQKQRERLLQSSDEEEDTVETEDNAEDKETTADDAENTEAVADEEDTEAEDTDDAEDITETEEAEENEEVEEAADASADSVNESEEVKEAPKTSVQSATDTDESAADKTPPTPQKSVKSADKAPFGLTWGASIEQTQKAGFEMQEITFGEYVGTGLIKNPQQQRTFFDKIVAVFGTRNRLNAVFAQSPFIDDLPNAEKALKIYHTYYEALAKKYGNDKEHFIPNDENENSAIGNDRFLKDLQEGKASLFATFHNDIIKVTLSVAVNAEAKSYVTMDYENTLLQQQEKDADLNELMKDL